MATQLAPEAVEPLQDNEAQTPRDYEAEAREHGWTPKEDFKGDPTRWVDAESFVTRAEEIMPLLKAQNASMKREMADLKKQMRKASEHFSKAEERAYAQAMRDLEARQDQAAEVGDVETVARIRDNIKAMSADVSETVNPVAAEAEEALEAWTAENKWYAENSDLREYAEFQATKYAGLTATMKPAEFFEFIGDKVKKQFPSEFAAKPGRPRPNNPVEGVGINRVGSGRRGFADLPPEAQRACDKWVKQGIIKSREDYVKSYQF